VLVVRPKEVRQESQEVVTGGFYVPPPGFTLSGHWNLAHTSVYSTTSYIKQNTVIPAECSIYNVKDEKLIWSGEIDTMLEKSFEKMGKGYAQSLYNQLKRDKVISKK
jgi:hypothetical protein